MESWLKESGASGLDDVELADFSDTGRGVKTLRPLSKGERIFTIPHTVLWTVKHAITDPILGPALHSAQPSLSTDDTLAVYILYVQSRKSGYDGAQTHVAALPTSYSSSILFTETELEVCAGSSLFTTTKHLNAQIEVDYNELDARLFQRYRELFPREKFSIDDYKWALCTVWSRAMDFKLPKGDSIRILAPFADMLNHSIEAERCHSYDPSSGNLFILAGKNYDIGDQIFINYGPVPNNRLSRLYGFVIPNNSNESYDLVLSTHPMAPHFQTKQKLWAMSGLDDTITIPLTLNEPLPSSVLRYLRIQRLSESDIVELLSRRGDAANEKICNSNEAEILGFLIESISGLLVGFDPQLEKLEEQLTQGMYDPAGNAWSAAHVSLGEQRVLRLTKRRAEALLATVESGNGDRRSLLSTSAQCAKCNTTSGQLKRCGRCSKVVYCGRSCQVAHYKEHKVLCQATVGK